ncbi:thiamine-phosphate kinase [Bacillus piscicola]|uniref:thiamine-phosphate kinase n=1 Tax=Bacillus piscicola TaxID=1632684 RepID=UPI001F08F2A6|nr:thiamine-phosphate kinase [Bacillus piscicola]
MLKDEFEWINQQRPTSHFHHSLIQGIGDDAAVFASSQKYEQLLCVDTLVEGIHFRKNTLSPEDVGHKALAVNISDIAAMGGEPLFYMAALAVPEAWSEEELAGVYKGMTMLGSRYNMDLIGGDTVSAPSDFMISVTVYGRIEKGHALLRRNARPGDIVFLTRPAGCSAAGLEILLQKGRRFPFQIEEKRLVSAHQRPEPCVEAGRVIASVDAEASLNDISDGLASELHEIAEASHCTIELDKNKIPVAPELQVFSEEQYWKWIFFGGEDFGLTGTVREKAWPRLQREMDKKELDLYPIGRVQAGSPAVFIVNGERRESLQKKGYNHFKKKR